MTRLTEEALARDLAKHADDCDACRAGDCAAADRIEASFWNEVDRRIDEAKERPR